MKKQEKVWCIPVQFTSSYLNSFSCTARLYILLLHFRGGLLGLCLYPRMCVCGGLPRQILRVSKTFYFRRTRWGSRPELPVEDVKP